jgi:hypothetical protein
MPGAEPWVRVEYDDGDFRLPGTAQLLQVIEGIRHHWQHTPRSVDHAPATMVIAIEAYCRLVAAATQPGAKWLPNTHQKVV